MVKIVVLRSMLAAAGLVATLGAASAVQAQAAPHTPQIKYEPVAAHPPIPDGLKISCTKVPDDGYQASKTCPVIHHGAYRTWIYSFRDNRTSFALVTYDSAGNVVQNITRDGARYVFDALSDDKGQKITIVGQAKQFIAVNWSDLPH